MSQPPPQLPHIGPIVEERGRRERFGARELAVALSHYDLDVIHSIREFPRGSRRAPKVRIRTSRGEFLFKRRAPGRDDPYRVAFTHELQLRLEDAGYPVPGLIGTRADHNSMLQLGEKVYEMFNFVRGRRFDGTITETGHAGAALARLHGLLAGYRSQYDAPHHSFHAASSVDPALAAVPDAVRAVEPTVDRAALIARCKMLGRAYRNAAAHVIDAGFDHWPGATLHGDWHPGNLLYREGEVVAVLDFDSARLEPRVIDVANGMLQFSLSMGPLEDPESWPAELDLPRLQAFARRYDEAAVEPLGPAEKRAVPWLIIEALVLETIMPIAATGTFAGIRGSAFLDVIARTVSWLQPRAEGLTELLEGMR
ncbi:MAG: phosphotransferase enzyme family protein [Planctomycetota bacterium]|jgi:homoserine kinase type II